MNNKQALTMAVAPIAIICLLGIGIRFLSVSEEIQDAKLRALSEERRERLQAAGLTARRAPRTPTAPAAPQYDAPATSAARRAIEKTIRGQVEAIAAGDFGKALGFATDSLQRMWSPEQFRSMIESDFSPLLTAKSLTFGEVKRAKDGMSDTAEAHVTVRGTAGELTGFIYFLNQEPGGWRINGVSPIIKRQKTSSSAPVFPSSN